MHAFRPDSLGKGWKSPSKPGFALQPPARLPLHPPDSLQERLSPLRFELCNSGVYSGENAASRHKPGRMTAAGRGRKPGQAGLGRAGPGRAGLCSPTAAKRELSPDSSG